MANRDNVQAPTSVLITDQVGKSYAGVGTTAPTTGVDTGLQVYANLGSAVISASVIEPGTPNAANSQTSVDTTSGGVQILAARATRRCAIIINTGTTDVYIGSGSVTTSNGLLLKGTKGASVPWIGTGACKGIVASGSITVTAIDFYD